MSNNHFSNLRADQQEALAILAEECGEVVQSIGKILRHGLLSHHPDGGPSNLTALGKECADVLAALDICESVGLLHTAHLRNGRLAKLERVRQYLHHVELPRRNP